MTNAALSPERSDLLEALATHRDLFRQTAQGLTDEQARLTPTASALSVGGLIKHVAAVEQAWSDFMVDGGGMNSASNEIDWSHPDPAVMQAYEDGFRLLETETLAEVLDEYARVAAVTDRLVAELPDLDRSFPLPAAPWFPQNGVRSVRRTIAHIIAETSQHAGHADIIRETIDGAKTMG